MTKNKTTTRIATDADHDRAYQVTEAVERTDRRAPHGWAGYLWSGNGYTGMNSAWALARSGLPITYQSAQRMLSAALRGESIASLTCDSMQCAECGPSKEQEVNGG